MEDINGKSILVRVSARFELLGVDCTTLYNAWSYELSVKFSTYPSKLKANLLGVFLGLHNIRKQNSIIVILFVKTFPS